MKPYQDQILWQRRAQFNTVEVPPRFAIANRLITDFVFPGKVPTICAHSLNSTRCWEGFPVACSTPVGQTRSLTFGTKINRDAVRFVRHEKLFAIWDLRPRRNLEAEACIEHHFLLPWLLVAWTLSESTSGPFKASTSYTEPARVGLGLIGVGHDPGEAELFCCWRCRGFLVGLAFARLRSHLWMCSALLFVSPIFQTPWVGRDIEMLEVEGCRMGRIRRIGRI